MEFTRCLLAVLLMAMIMVGNSSSDAPEQAVERFSEVSSKSGSSMDAKALSPADDDLKKCLGNLNDALGTAGKAGLNTQSVANWASTLNQGSKLLMDIAGELGTSVAVPGMAPIQLPLDLAITMLLRKWIGEHKEKGDQIYQVGAAKGIAGIGPKFAQSKRWGAHFTHEFSGDALCVDKNPRYRKITSELYHVLEFMLGADLKQTKYLDCWRQVKPVVDFVGAQYQDVMLHHRKCSDAPYANKLESTYCCADEKKRDEMTGAAMGISRIALVCAFYEVPKVLPQPDASMYTRWKQKASNFKSSLVKFLKGKSGNQCETFLKDLHAKHPTYLNKLAVKCPWAK